ncbi:hypothetical protein [Mesorhizobium sp. CN2-181]
MAGADFPPRGGEQGCPQRAFSSRARSPVNLFPYQRFFAQASENAAFSN